MRNQRWFVRAEDGAHLGDVVSRWGEKAQRALAEGRVFLNGRRQSSASASVAPGDLLELYAARTSSTDIEVLAEQSDIVAILKPAELPTEPDRQTSTESARALLARRLKLEESRLHAASRLDVGVSGVVLFATSGAAARRLASAKERGRLERRYVAIVAGRAQPLEGAWTAPISTNQGQRDARTEYATVSHLELANATLSPGKPSVASVLALRPVTGRTHQLRLHCQRASAPILGDRRYGGASRLRLPDGSVQGLGRIALHAARVVLSDHGTPWVVEAAPSEELVVLWEQLGGDRDVFTDAVRMGVPRDETSSMR